MSYSLPRTGYILLVCVLFLGHAAGVFQVETGTASLPSIHAGWPAYDDIILTPEFLLLALIGLLLSFSLPQMEPIPASLLTIACTVLPVYLVYSGILDTTILPLEYYLLTILMLFVVNVLISYYTYSHQRQQIINTFSHYVPAEVVNELCRNPGSFSLEGESRELTVLFADLVNFTSIAETLEPRELTQLINRHFDLVTNILLEHQATIDKYIGDSIMAFWGAPLAQDNHTENAVAAAFAIQDAVNNTGSNLDRDNLTRLEIRIGLNRGIMNVGNIGSYKRASYTVIGDAVNVASRLERLTREYKVPIIVSESVAKAAPNYVFRHLDSITLRGRQDFINIYQPLYRTSEINDLISSQDQDIKLA